MNAGLLTFEIAGAAFAVDEESVVEVAEAVPATRLPFVPPQVEGLANVTGRILPVVDLTGYAGFGLSWPAERRGNLLIVLRAGGGLLALRAARIGGTLDRGRLPLEVPPDAPQPGAVRLPVAAQGSSGGRVLRLLDPDRIDLGHGMGFAGMAEGDALVGAAPPDEGAQPPGRRLLVVEAGGHGHALSMQDMVLVFPVGELRALPDAPAMVCGMGRVQRRPVLLVDPFGTAPPVSGGKDPGMGPGIGPGGYAVVYATPAGPVGVRVDAVRGVVRFADERIKTVETKVPGAPDEIVEYDGRWLDVRSGARMLGDHLDRIGRLIPETGDLADSRLPQRHYRRFLTFAVDGRLYAVEFERVRRVVESSERLRLPGGAESFDGITDIDGSILPILDLRRLLAKRPVGTAPGRPGTAILMDIAGGTVAVIVDEVQRIRKVATDDVDPMSDRLTAAVIRLDEALIPVLRPEGLMAGTVAPPLLPTGRGA